MMERRVDENGITTYWFPPEHEAEDSGSGSVRIYEIECDKCKMRWWYHSENPEPPEFIEDAECNKCGSHEFNILGYWNSTPIVERNCDKI